MNSFSFFALETSAEWCSVKVGVLQKAILTCSSPLGKIMSRGSPEDVPENCSDVLRKSPYGPKGCIRSRTSSGRQFDHNP